MKNSCLGSVMVEPFAVNVKVEDGSPMKIKTNVEWPQV